jgi:hypothetical protein
MNWKNVGEGTLVIIMATAVIDEVLVFLQKIVVTSIAPTELVEDGNEATALILNVAVTAVLVLGGEATNPKMMIRATKVVEAEVEVEAEAEVEAEVEVEVLQFRVMKRIQKIKTTMADTRENLQEVTVVRSRF